MYCPFCEGIAPLSYWNMDTCQKWLDKEKLGYNLLDIKTEDSKVRVNLQCPNKSHPPYWADWNHIRHGGTGCKLCYYKRENKVDWNLDNAREYLAKNGFTMLDETKYISSHQPVYCKDETGFIYQVRVNFLLRGRENFSLLRNNDYAIHNIKLFMKLYRPDYEFIDTEYRGHKEIHKWKYLDEGLPDGTSRIFEQSVGAMISSYCKHPLLSKSQLEIQCQFILDKYHINYKTQKTFDGCVGKSKLRYDFYIKLNGKEYCIETDGLQHDVPVEKFGGIKEFEKRQKYDKIKNDYCKEHNIELIRIKQKEYKNMENILVERLNLDREESVA